MDDEDLNKGEGAANSVPRPRILVAIIIGSLFTVEAVIMNFFHELAETVHFTMNAFILTAVNLPLIYFFIYRPFSQSVKNLRAFSRTLERQVRERTLQLESSEALHRAVIASSADAIVRINGEGAILSANPAALRMFGYLEPELENKPISLLLPDGHEKVQAEGGAASLNGGNGKNPAPIAEVAAVTKSGQKLMVECASSECLVNSEISFVIVMRDVTGRKKAEAELISIMEAQPDILYVINTKGALVKWNSALQQLCGLTREQMMERPAADFVCEEDRQVVFEGTKEVFEKGSASIEVRFLKWDGSLVPHLCTGAAWRNPDGELLGFIGVGKDITELKKTEQELAESEKKFRGLFQGMVSGFSLNEIVFNERGEPVDYITLEVNRAFERLVGVSKENVIGKKAYEVVPGLERKWLDIFAKVAVTGMPSTYVEYASNVGKWFEGTVFCPRKGFAACTFIDITERKRAEEKVRQHEIHLLQAQRVAGLGSYTYDITADRWTSSDVLNQIFGIGADFDHSAAGWAGIVHPDDRQAMQKALLDCTEGKRNFDQEYRIIRPVDGNERWLHGLGEVEHGADGRPSRIVGTNTDITARKKAEEALRESEERYRQLSEAGFEGIVVAIGGKILDANSAFARIFGYPRDEIIGKTALDLAPPESHAIIMDHIGRASDEVYDAIGLKKDGTPFSMEIQGRAILYLGQKARLTAIRDITERKRNEGLLRESEQKFMRFFTMLPVALGVVNKDGVISEFNARFTEVLGYTIDDIPTIKEWWERAYPDEAYRRWVLDTWGKAVDKAAKEGTDIEPIEYKVTCKNGAERFVMIGGILLLNGDVLATFVDVTEKKKAEEALRESEERLRATFDHATSGMALVSLDGKFARVNMALCRMFGYGQTELIGKSFREITHPDDILAVETFPQGVAGGEKAKLEVEKRYIRKDGRVIWCSVVASVIKDARGKPLHQFAHIIDITAHKEAEDNLRASEQRFRAVAQSATDAVISINGAGEIIQWNRGAEKMFGYAENEALGKPVDLLIPRRYEKNHRIGLARAAAGGPYRLVGKTAILEGLRKDGSEFPLELSLAAWEEGGKTYFTGIIRDITERRRVENALFESEDKFRALVEETSDWVWEVDQNGIFTYSSPQVREITGYGPEEILGKTPFDYLRPDEAIRGIEFFRATAAAQNPFKSFVHTTIHKDGHEVVVETSGVPYFNVEGKFVGYRGVNRDITERKEAEEKLKAAKEAAEEATRMKDKFVSLVSHDLKTPLSSMIGFLKLVRNDYAEPLNEGAKLILDRAAESGEAMVRLIEDLLTISRFKTGQLKLHRQFFDAEYLGVMMAGNYSHLAAQKGIEIENTIPVNYRIYGDKTLLTEAVQNLVTNAIKFCKSGDRITISAETGVPPVIHVRDTGPGIQPNLLDDLFKFEKKTSTRGTAGETGTGFGLPLVREIMLLHGGELAVDSRSGKGCLFSLKLPYVRPKILLVDDDRISRLLQKRRLEELNAEIIEAENGEDALDVVESVRLDLVITDINMPVMDGLELLKRIKGSPNTRAIPVIVMSGEFGMEMRDTIFKFGGDDFVTKNSADKADFIPRVRRFIG